jgi:hypothetical protein
MSKWATRRASYIYPLWTPCLTRGLFGRVSHGEHLIFILCEHLVSPPVYLVGSVTVSILYFLCEHLVSPPVYLVGSMLLILSVFSVVFFSFCLSSVCVFCVQCCQHIQIVHSWLPLLVFSNVHWINKITLWKIANEM